MPPTIGHGKICYLEIPCKHIAESARFYRNVFGWKTRIRSDGHHAFDDGVNEVSGTWVLNREPAKTAGLLIYIMVENAGQIVNDIIANGGKIIQPVGKDAPEITARFTDPAENLFGIYQEPK